MIIPTLNRGYALIETLRCLEKADRQGLQVIIVDQSQPYLAEVQQVLDTLIKKLNIDYIHESRPSLPNARNIGLAAAKGEYCIYIDDDVEFGPDFIQQHYTFLKQKNLVAAGGRVIQSNFPEVGDEPIVFTSLARVEGAYLNSQVERKIDTARGCNMAFKTETLRDIGGFDLNYIGSAGREESDVCLRLRNAGHQIWLNPKAAVVHLESPSGGCRQEAPRTQSKLAKQAEPFRNDSLFFMKFFNHLLLPRYIIGIYKVFAWDNGAAVGLWGKAKQVLYISVGITQGVAVYYQLKRSGALLV